MFVAWKKKILKNGVVRRKLCTRVLLVLFLPKGRFGIVLSVSILDLNRMGRALNSFGR